ncbi:MAG: hypothetical protein AAGL34_05855 [Bacteroidota bacterium]
MKALLTTIAVLFITVASFGNTPKAEVKVETVTQGVTLDIKIEDKAAKEVEVARLYRFKNARVKKALSFKTKRSRAKLA